MCEGVCSHCEHNRRGRPSIILNKLTAMTDMISAWTAQTATPRQDRLESEIVGVLRAGGTRSSLRTRVEDFTMFARVRGATFDEIVRTLDGIATKVRPELIARGEAVVGESAPDRLTMMIRWARARFNRAD